MTDLRRKSGVLEHIAGEELVEDGRCAGEVVHGNLLSSSDSELAEVTEQLLHPDLLAIVMPLQHGAVRPDLEEPLNLGSDGG